MPTFTAYDGTSLAFHLAGEGAPLVCIPGGPMQASAYLGDLGGLSQHRKLVMLDLRGTGESAAPQDPDSYRCDRLVDDVEALREELGLDRMDLLAHSAGANLAVLYATRHPERVSRLALITPSTYAVAIMPAGETRLAIARLRSSEPWFAEAYAALTRITAGDATDADWAGIAPFYYARWDADSQAHYGARSIQINEEAGAVFVADGAFDPDATRTALATLEVPVLFVAGGYDLSVPASTVAEYAEVLPNTVLLELAGTGHFPWLDAADPFVAGVVKFFR